MLLVNSLQEHKKSAAKMQELIEKLNSKIKTHKRGFREHSLLLIFMLQVNWRT